MNAELRAITRNQLREMLGDIKYAETIWHCSAGADPLFVAELGKVVLGYVAFVPYSTLSDTAYVWVHTTPEAARHGLAVARLARRWLPTFHSRYPNLRGHCFTAPARNWLRTLNARFWPDNLFTIEAANG